MRNIFLLICILFLFSNAAFSEEITDKRTAFQTLQQSNLKMHNLCRDLSDNFRRDHQFSYYIKNRCILFESNRQMLLGILYTFPNHYVENFTEQYPSLMSSYTQKMNDAETKALKDIVTEYCKYNNHKIYKKSPEACSQTVLKSLF